MCKKNCLKCHFFSVYGDHDIQGRCQRSLALKERDEIIKEKSFFCAQLQVVDYRTYLCCYKKVWDEVAISRAINSRKSISAFSDEEEQKLKEKLLEIVVKTERKSANPHGNSCFYIPYQEGMSLEGAAELENREYVQKEASAERKWVKWGVLVAAAALVVGSLWAPEETREFFKSLHHEISTHLKIYYRE